MRRFEGDPWRRPFGKSPMEGTDLLGVEPPSQRRAQPMAPVAPLRQPSGTSGATSLASNALGVLAKYLGKKKPDTGPPLPTTGGDYKKGGEVKGKTQNTKQPQIPKGTPGGGKLKVKK